ATFRPAALGDCEDRFALKAEGEEPLNPVVYVLTADAQDLANYGLARITVAVLIDIGREAAERLPQVVWQRGEQSRVARVKVHFDEHPLFAVTRRKINLGLKFDRNEGLTFGIVRLRVHTERKRSQKLQAAMRCPLYERTAVSVGGRDYIDL